MLSDCRINMKEATILQLVFAAVMLVSSILAGVSPFYIKSFRQNPVYSSLGNCFSGGVFLSVAIIHLLPDGNSSLEDAIGSEVPLGYILAIIGYLAILFVEKIIFAGHEHQNLDESMHLMGSGGNSRNAETNESTAQVPGTQTNAKGKVEMTGIILAVALSIHSIFEGIAIGLQDSADDTLSVGLAVCVHKLPAALALGIYLLEVPRKKAFLLLGIFSGSSPLGILIGIGLQSMDQPALEGVFVSLCSGTFLYIATSEVITGEFSKPINKGWKYVALCIGFVVSAALMVLIEE